MAAPSREAQYSNDQGKPRRLNSFRRVIETIGVMFHERTRVLVVADILVDKIVSMFVEKKLQDSE